MAPEKREGAPKSAPDLLGREIVTSISAIGRFGQPNPPSPLSEFEAQSIALAARLRMSEASARVVLYHLRGGRQ